MLATSPNAEAVPVTIRGSVLCSDRRPIMYGAGRWKLLLGKPIPSEGVSAAELANRVREEILTTFNHGKTLDRNSYSLSRKV